MEREQRLRRNGAVGALLFFCLAALPGYGAVTADPAKVTFTSPQQSAVIGLTRDGVPVVAADIRGWQLLASGHDYQHMLRIEKRDGALTVAPGPALEVGSYDLTIATTDGPVLVQVYAPLSDLPDVVEKTMAVTGLSEKTIKERLGLTSPAGREELTIDLPPVYYAGQTLELTLPLQSGRSATWFVNDTQVPVPAGQNTAALYLPRAGRVYPHLPRNRERKRADHRSGARPGVHPRRGPARRLRSRPRSRPRRTLQRPPVTGNTSGASTGRKSRPRQG